MTMKIKQISLFVENKPGTLHAPCKVLSDAGISITTLSLADTKFFGVLRMLTADWQKAKEVLEQNGFAVRLTDVVAIEVDHKPGSMTNILDVLDKNGLNVEYMYAYAAGVNDKAALIFRFADADEAIAKLQNAPGIRIISGDMLPGMGK